MAKKKDITALIKEATQHVEDELSLEDRGWLKFGTSADTVDPASRVKYVAQSRLYSVFDPLCCQAIRLWTSYAFGTGMTWNTVTDSATEKALLEFYDNNRSMLSAAGQRKSSDKYLVDGEVFFALFIGNGGSNPTSIRRIDPLEITEIISDPDDIEDVRYYKREWTDAQAKVHVGYYRSYTNVKDEKTMDMYGAYKTSTEDALIYHVSGGIGQRGVPLLLPALDWAYEYRRFLASRIAVVLALAQFAWKNKIDGSAATVAAAKAQIDTQKRDHSAKTIIENAGANWEPIKTDTGAGNAYTDGRMIKLMIFAATGFPEQYFSDVSVGNLATAKSVELPVSKMIQDYQQMWHDVYAEIHGIVLQGAGIETPDEIDIDFPLIAPEDTISLATSIAALVAAFPGFGDLSAVQQQALNALGVEDVAGAIEDIEKQDAVAAAGEQVAKGVDKTVNTGATGDTAENIAGGEKLNGIQIQAALTVITQFIGGQIPHTVAIELLVAVGIDRDRAAAMIAEAQRFTPKELPKEPEQLQTKPVPEPKLKEALEVIKARLLESNNGK